MTAKKEKGHLIAEIIEGGIAWELGVEPGDKLLQVCGKYVEDVFDFHYLTNEEYLTVTIEKASGEIWELDIEKEYEEDLGIVFSDPLMDGYRSCSNRCIFCFIDQMPKGMRPTLYFKDDDARLSFLQGNYVTLTNMRDHDIDRIIRYRLEPINISFHTMDPALRRQMLGNRFAGDIFGKVQRLHEAGIEMNGQIVLCRGYNDGDALDYSLRMFEQYLPSLKSVSVVPVGLTKFREGLTPLEGFGKEEALRLIDQVERWQSYYMERYGTHLVHASDEWYIMADRPIPDADSYDGYLQLENGVGMIRLLLDECDEALLRRRPGAGTDAGNKKAGEDRPARKLSIATGVLAAPFIRQIVEKIEKEWPQVCCTVYTIRNRFFGETITVSGLITGHDLMEQLKGRDLGDALLLPCNMLRSQENVFLDDITTNELERALGTPVIIAGSSGEELVSAVLGEDGINE